MLALVAFAAIACGDPESTDHRGYTKAPLEHPSLAIRGEQPSEISQYGAPNRVTAEVIELAEEPAEKEEPSPQPVPAVDLPEGVTQDMVAQGQEIYGGAGNCRVCHGATGGGTPGLAPALNDREWLNGDGSFESIVEVIATGVPAPKQNPGPMPARGGSQITDDQVRQVAAYVFSISR